MNTFFRRAEYNDPTTILVCGAYKYETLDGRRGDETKDHPYSTRLARLRAGDLGAVEWFYRFLLPQLTEGFVVAVVPPCKRSSSATSGVGRLGIFLSQGGRQNGVECLSRDRPVPPLGGSGGVRTIEQHLDSIGVRQHEVLRGQRVLLLDDLAGTGNSIRACTRLLEDAGATEVQSLVLARVNPETIRRGSSPAVVDPKPLRRTEPPPKPDPKPIQRVASRPENRSLVPKQQHPTWKPGVTFSRSRPSRESPPGATGEVSGRRSARRLVVDDAPGPKYQEMLDRFGAIGDND